MAGLGHKTFTRERLTSADVNGYLMDQSVMVYPSASARQADLASPSFGMVTYLEDTQAFECYVPAGASGTWVDAFGETTPAIEVSYTGNYKALNDATAGWSGLRFWKRSGITALHGAISATNAAGARDIVAILPVGFRPPATVQLSPSGQVTAAGEIRLGTAGIAAGGSASFGGAWPIVAAS